ncbi:MAG: toxin-antitoxin system HicB family antitoxin [Longimicrobiales bacterium]
MARGLIELNLSVPVVLEYEAVRKRPGMVPTYTAGEIDDLIDGLCAMAQQRRIYFLWRPQLKDAKDEAILELAVGADHASIVTPERESFSRSGALWCGGLHTRSDPRADWSTRMSTISLRLPDSIHRKVKELAARDGSSVNQFLATAAAEKVAALEAEEYLAERARRGQRARFLELLAKAPAIEPDDYDRLPDGHERASPAKRAGTRAAGTRKPSRSGRQGR